MPLIYRTKLLTDRAFEGLATADPVLFKKMVLNTFVWEAIAGDNPPDDDAVELWMQTNCKGLLYMQRYDTEEDADYCRVAISFEYEEDAAAFVLKWATET